MRIISYLMEKSIRRVNFIVDLDELFSCIDICTALYSREKIEFEFNVTISEIIKVEFILWK